jgi:hypothetical protein
LLVLALLAAPGSPAAAIGYEDWVDWASWSRVRAETGGVLASSHARDGTNQDYNYYEAPAGHQTGDTPATIATIPGPGLLYRIWMPHVTANLAFPIRMFFDGESTPRIDTNSAQLLGGNYGYFAGLLVTTFAGGQVCYEPIPFQTEVRIESENRAGERHYYQYTGVTLPAGTSVGTFTGTLDSEQQAARDSLVTMFQNVGQHPAGPSDTEIQANTGPVSIPAGATRTVADVAGSGTGRQLDLRLSSPTDADLASLVLRVQYDDETDPAIDAPVGLFFGAGSLRAPYHSLVLGTDGPDGYYCYWPMPFRSRIVVELHNAGPAAIAIDEASFRYEAGPVDDDQGTLRTAVSTTVRAVGQLLHPLFSASGRGHWVGSLLRVEQSVADYWILEGDEIVTVDGELVLNGTGLEDAYNGGYYYNCAGDPGPEPEGPCPESAIRPLHGLLFAEYDETAPRVRADQYRWLIADRVPFDESIDVQIECRYGVPGSVWESIAFWYELPPAPTGAGPEPAAPRPELELRRNYPNPVQNATTIEFFLPRAGLATVEIFDVTGRRIRTLLDEVRERGSHRIVWEPGDLPAGVYYYRLTSGDASRTRRATIVSDR